MPTDEPALSQLTSRELEVLKLIARGHSNAEIASQVYVSDATVKIHVKQSSKNSTSATAPKPLSSPTKPDSPSLATPIPPTEPDAASPQFQLGTMCPTSRNPYNPSNGSRQGR